MSILDIYKFIRDLQEKIGDDARVNLRTMLEGVLEIRISWPYPKPDDDRAYLLYVYAISDLEMQHIINLEDDIVYKANRAYKLATVGEE